MAAKISPAQRKVLEAGRALGYTHAAGLCPPTAWMLKDRTRVTSTVDALLKSGLMKRDGFGGNRRAVITDAGRTALAAT